MPIECLNDKDKIYSGAIIRFYNKDKAIAEDCCLCINPTDYIVSEIYSNHNYFQLTCLSKGEEGNILCVLESQQHYTLGKEIKRMLTSDLYEVLINFDPKIVIN